ncbi:hypothetical protein DSM3645_26874 [Blastopirellula marina DSM 3645]|uniref:Uncharacterized protein n=1 Tax=Blastopirellula marina DSM 3645 TaxID=314230 RepID=A3ZYA0_9BACT|nr:hypothetical protein DSM3645_26874 [Blastopirellula marina DSM 3645]
MGTQGAYAFERWSISAQGRYCERTLTTAELKLPSVLAKNRNSVSQIDSWLRV